MKIKAKRRTPIGIDRIEAPGEIKEVFVKEDIFSPEKGIINVCFRNNNGNSSGIIELSLEEAKSLSESFNQILNQNKSIKVFKEKK